MIDSSLKKKDIRLNLTSVLDATFILTFFLLKSAQFIDIYQIGSDAPAVTSIESLAPNAKKPLNLVLEITMKDITVKTGLSGQVVKKIERNVASVDLPALQDTLAAIKQDHPDESSVVFRPDSNVSYDDLVKIMDTARELEKNRPSLGIKQSDGSVMETRKLFDQIIFETII